VPEFAHALPERRPVSLGDVLLAIALFGFGVLEVALGRPGHLWPDVAIAACATLPLALRRRLPIAPVLGVSAALLLFAAAGEKNSTYIFALGSTLVALYSLGAYAIDVVRLGGLVVAAACGVTSALSEPGHGASDALFAAGVVTVPWVVGVLSHRREHVAAGLRERAERLEREQAAREREAVAVERERIARELHDIVAHAVTLMVVQANAGERQVRSDPLAAERAFAVVKESGRAALTDLRRMLDLLRADSAAPARVPQLSAAAIEELAEGARRAGATVSVEADRLDGVPESVVVAVHRLVQEALTNATRHAHGAPISIELRRSPSDLRLTVRNAAGTPIAEAVGGGYGLIGMRERVAVFDGAFEAHRIADDGFVVNVVLPLGGTS
jgi:signal transduction histidine kinase